VLGAFIARPAAAAPRQSEPIPDGRAAASLCKGCFIDADQRLRLFNPTYEAWFGAHQRFPHYWLAVAEDISLLAAGTAYYWIRPQLNKVDWDFPDAATRLQYLAAAFDNNQFKTNQALHPTAGSAYYLLARECGLSPFEAFAYSAGSSAVFEFLLEWLEKVSYNDLIVTPTAGVAGGEFVYKLAEYLNSGTGEHDAVQEVAEFSLGLPSKIHGAPHESPKSAQGARDNLGLSAAYFHKFQVLQGVGLVRADAGPSLLSERLALEGEIVTLPGHLRAGRFDKAFHQADFSRMRLHYAVGNRDLDADAYFETTLLGYYTQDFAASPAGVGGHAAMIGASMAYRYKDTQPAGDTDQYSFVHLLGPRAQSWFAWRGLFLGLGADVHYDFGAVRSLAYPHYVAAFGKLGTKSVLQEQGYQFVQGASGRAEVALSYGGLSLGARQGLGLYWSVQGGDRFQSDTVHDVLARESLKELDLWVRAGLPAALFQFGFDYNRSRHHSEMRPFANDRLEERVTFSSGLRF
jgi:hypothetical protein